MISSKTRTHTSATIPWSISRGRRSRRSLAAGRSRPRLAARYLQAIAEAIDYAHQQGILHRDLKPSNILLKRHDGEFAAGGLADEFEPMVADFGLAARIHTDRDPSSQGAIVGTAAYMPPEQARGKQADRTSDVYSLGATLYELLVGRPPFQSASREEILRAVLEDQVTAPRVLNPAIPADLETICLKCLEKKSDRRYASAHDLADDLHRFLNDLPIKVAG